LFFQYIDEHAQDKDAPIDEGALDIDSEEEYVTEHQAKKRRKEVNERDADDVDSTSFELELSGIPNIHSDDLSHFFKLSKSLQLLIGRTITNTQIDEAEVLLRGYCLELLTVSLTAVNCLQNKDINSAYVSFTVLE